MESASERDFKREYQHRLLGDIHAFLETPASRIDGCHACWRVGDQVLRETLEVGHARDSLGRTRVTELTSAGVPPSCGVIRIDGSVSGERYRLQRQHLPVALPDAALHRGEC